MLDLLYFLKRPFSYFHNFKGKLNSLFAIENRIYREELTRKKCKTAILWYCFHTASVLHIFMLYNMLGPGISFYRKSKLIVKRKPNYEIGWIIIDLWSFHIDFMPSTLQTIIFLYNYKSNDIFIHLIHYKVYLTV